MIKMERAVLSDAQELLKIQHDAFKTYADKYGDFESNPYHMSLHRMEFNINYRFGQYYKIIDDQTNQVIGGIFGFELEQPEIMKIAQFYLNKDYRGQGYGTEALSFFLNHNQQVKTWYVDTIMQEEYNVEFYHQLGFNIIDEEEEHEGLTFVTMMKKVN